MPGPAARVPGFVRALVLSSLGLLRVLVSLWLGVHPNGRAAGRRATGDAEALWRRRGANAGPTPQGEHLTCVADPGVACLGRASGSALGISCPELWRDPAGDKNGTPRHKATKTQRRGKENGARQHAQDECPAQPRVFPASSEPSFCLLLAFFVSSCLCGLVFMRETNSKSTRPRIEEQRAWDRRAQVRERAHGQADCALCASPCLPFLRADETGWMNRE